jgi:beta-1,4-mannosyltransferase
MNAVRAGDDSSPRVGVFPYYTDNPYTDLLYLSVRAVGYTVVPFARYEAFLRGIVSFGPGDVIHVQWTSQIALGRDRREAEGRVKRFRHVVSAARRRGVALIWTIHNRLPHDAKFVDLEVEIAKFLVASASAIHILSPATVDAVRDLYPLPEHKTVVIAHPSYLGVYPTSHSRAEARRSFGLPETATVLLFFGQHRAYKGLERLVAATSRLASSRPDLVLLVAGARARVETDDVQRWFAATDVTVLPYVDVLNSGTTMLSATFGKPVFLPDKPHLREQYGHEPWVHLFSVDERGEGLERAIGAFRPRELESVAAQHFVEAASPQLTADQFRDLVERIRLEELVIVASR